MFAQQIRGFMACRKIRTSSLTIDHRAVDNAPGTRFLQASAGIMVNPAALNDRLHERLGAKRF